MSWYHVTTRVMGLLEIWLATEVYPKFPITKRGFNLDTVVIGKNGILERYVNEDQLNKFQKLVETNDYTELLEGFEKQEKRMFPFFEEFKKNPIGGREEFMKNFRQLWIHEITSFFIGLYCTDKKSLDVISNLRGTKSAQHIAISKLLPILLNEISDNTGINAELLKYALPEELLSLKLNAKTLTSRQKRYVMELINGSMRLSTGQDAKKYEEKFSKNIKKLIDKNVSELIGKTAYHGKVSGKVAIVNRETDLKNVRAGNILVSPMTRTSFLPAMKKAAAFVTDEGGITCHAAIVARELKKPCVVGTKIASKVLKNGTKVEVDANKGIVRILKKK